MKPKKQSAKEMTLNPLHKAIDNALNQGINVLTACPGLVETNHKLVTMQSRDGLKSFDVIVKVKLLENKSRIIS